MEPCSGQPIPHDDKNRGKEGGQENTVPNRRIAQRARFCARNRKSRKVHVSARFALRKTPLILARARISLSSDASSLRSETVSQRRRTRRHSEKLGQRSCGSLKMSTEERERPALPCTACVVLLSSCGCVQTLESVLEVPK
jgi:hypothetical protein